MVLGISKALLLRSILRTGKASAARPKHNCHHLVQIGESRDKRDTKELLKKLQGAEISFYCTDQWGRLPSPAKGKAPHGQETHKKDKRRQRLVQDKAEKAVKADNTLLKKTDLSLLNYENGNR